MIKNSRHNTANGHRILLGSILCLFALCVIAAQKGPKKRPARKQDTRVFLLHADVLHYDQFVNPNAQILVLIVGLMKKKEYLCLVITLV